MHLAKPSDFPCRFLTHNIRFAASSLFEGERPWEERREPLLSELLYHTRNLDSFICLQEVLRTQLVDVLSGLNGREYEWAYIGVGRDDGQTQGEYSPIFYRPAVWELRHWETVWLSETPEVPSKGWDASSIRIVTVGVFTHRTGGHTMLVMNTHLDDQGSSARSEAAHLILRRIRDYQQGDWGSVIGGKVVLAGDLNSEEHQEAYAVLTAAHSPLLDTGKEVSGIERYGDRITWTGFGHEPEPPSRLDYIFTHRESLWHILGHAVLPNRFEDGVYMSDHRAVVTDVAKW